MRVLFVVPVEEGSGETVTSVHVARELHAAGWPIAFLGSEFALRFVPESLEAPRWSFGGDGPGNARTWETALRAFRPDIVLFADYPLMLFIKGAAPLARVPGWVDALDRVDAALVTFDHFGFAQQTAPLFMGPPHLGLSAQHFEPLPRRMRVLRPCPMHEPDTPPGVAGEPFRSCPLPLGLSAEQRRSVRATWLGSNADGLLVFHSVPNWAWRHAERLQLALYEVLPRLLETYFGPLADRITFVSSNNGQLLQSPAGARLRITNLGPVPVATFEDLLYAADLVLSENGLSIAIGKAVCAQQAAAVFRNSFRLAELTRRADAEIQDVLTLLEARRLGAVFPFETFPTVTPADVEAIGIYDRNTLTEGFVRLEVFGGRDTSEAMQRLLTDPPTRDALRVRQQNYVDKLLRLDDVSSILARMVTVS
jgi:uncharacterized protein DUF6365